MQHLVHQALHANMATHPCYCCAQAQDLPWERLHHPKFCEALLSKQGQRSMLLSRPSVHLWLRTPSTRAR